MTRRRVDWPYTLAVWFGCGHAPRWPGTVGTLGAMPVYALALLWGRLGVVVAAAVVTVVGIVVASDVARRLQQRDPQIIVIDEVAGMLTTLVFAEPTWPIVALAFVLFRVFDCTKPWPAGAAERLHGGWGIVLDDVAAGFWAGFVLLLLRSFARVL